MIELIALLQSPQNRDCILDGGFGREQTAADLGTIADLSKLPAIFSRRGYSQADVEKIMHGNFLNFLRKNWN